MRLNKYLSEAGVCSRREADRLIEKGDVTIDDHVATLGEQVEGHEVVKVKGKRVGEMPDEIYIALNKPIGIECTTNRQVKDNIIDYVGYPERIFPIGRLDKPSEGLILLTNDGDLSNAILKARHFHEKEYIVTVNQPVTSAFLKKMGSGVPILETVTRPCKVAKISERTFSIILTQGLNRQIRRMCEALGYRVRKLKRIRVLNIELGDLQSGKWRHLSESEIQNLKAIIRQ